MSDSMRNLSGSVGVSGVHWGAGRECRYSGASRGIGGIRGLLGVVGVSEGMLGPSGGLGAVRGCQGCTGG